MSTRDVRLIEQHNVQSASVSADLIKRITRQIDKRLNDKLFYPIFRVVWVFSLFKYFTLKTPNIM